MCAFFVTPGTPESTTNVDPPDVCDHEYDFIVDSNGLVVWGMIATVSLSA